MNWDIVSALAEASGAIGVIVSLVYLARQIAHNTQATRLDAAFRVMHATTASTGLPLVGDAELSARVLRASSGEAPADPGERIQVQAWFFVTLKTVENAHYQFEQDALDAEVWHTWEAFWSNWVRMPGFRAYWQDRRTAFLPSFRRVVDGWILSDVDEHAMKPIGEAGRNLGAKPSSS